MLKQAEKIEGWVVYALPDWDTDPHVECVCERFATQQEAEVFAASLIKKNLHDYVCIEYWTRRYWRQSVG